MTKIGDIKGDMITRGSLQKKKKFKINKTKNKVLRINPEKIL